MKINYSITMVAIICTALFSCSKNDTTTVITPTVPASSPITAGNISGFVKGTLITGSTYTITGDLTIKAGDTLASQQGVIVIIKNNAQINVNGVLNLVGTKEQPISFNSDSQKPGTWGGFRCDSAKAINIKWTHVDNTGGADPSGYPRPTVFVSSPINVDIEDSWFTNGQDDILRLQGGTKVTLLRNTITSCGSTDGEAINLKSGVTGDVAYNVIYNQSGSAVKLETSKLAPFPQTVVNIYNNTMASCGWRRGAAEPGRGVSIGLNAIGIVYNNLIVNNYQGMEIFTDADTIHTKYGYNMFYATTANYTDTTAHPNISISIAGNYYPSDGVGKKQSTDQIAVNPMFVSFDGTVAAPNGATFTGNFHLQTGSPAFGKGNPTYSNDIGAYTSDAIKSNQH